MFFEEVLTAMTRTISGKHVRRCCRVVLEWFGLKTMNEEANETFAVVERFFMVKKVI